MTKANNQVTVSLREEKTDEEMVIADIVEIVSKRAKPIALATLGQEIRRRHRGFNVKIYGSSDHGLFQARVLEWVAISFSRKMD